MSFWRIHMEKSLHNKISTMLYKYGTSPSSEILAEDKRVMKFCFDSRKPMSRKVLELEPPPVALFPRSLFLGHNGVEYNTISKDLTLHQRKHTLQALFCDFPPKRGVFIVDLQRLQRSPVIETHLDVLFQRSAHRSSRVIFCISTNSYVETSNVRHRLRHGVQ
ncbi:hypothetical protein B0H12DRAFT_1107876 [Mycena haematopus]|nr:hypothetical protein B0H12DRAFT_1107876 [Mycena haematopus]